MTVLPNLQQQLEAALAENARLKADAQAKLTFKVSEKGAVSIYGMGRWPTTLYRSQIEALFAPSTIQRLQTFLEANRSKLSVKGE